MTEPPEERKPNRITSMSKIPTSSSRVSIVALLAFGIILLSLQSVDSMPKGHGGGSSSPGSKGDEPSGTYYNVVDYNDNYPTNKTANATDVAQLPPFTKTWPPASDDEDDPDETSFPNPEYVR